jgi:hypothetical protein
MYGWTNREMLEEMTLGQMKRYLELGIDLQKPKGDPNSSENMTAEELREEKEELKRLYGDI